MKRSEINKEIKNACKLFANHGFKLPAFASWEPEEWASKGHEVDEIVENMLGWDVTDFGCNRFNQMGLLLFTMRNGNYANPDKYPKTYAEKLMICKQGQVCPMHFHWKKKEDIINRGGGNLGLVLHLSNRDKTLSKAKFTASIDGVKTHIMPGREVILKPGESIFLEPFVYHTFYAQKNTGYVVIGEVSEVNDDKNDNCFLEPIGRFPAIEEDEPPLHLLCTEYSKWIDTKS